MQTQIDVLLATRNKGKLGEFARLLSDLPIGLRSLEEFPDAVDVEESGGSFEENATIKAQHFVNLTRISTLADDSGLEVDSLGGAPGVRSARYAGPNATDSERIARLLATLDANGDAERRARFVCALAFALHVNEEIIIFVGKCEGRIAPVPRGHAGFGYDPIFIPDGYSQTFGELTSEVKNLISHRANAIKAARDYFRSQLFRR